MDALTLTPQRSLQTISGTGANHLGALFLERFYGPWTGKSKAEKIIYVSNPSWGASCPLCVPSLPSLISLNLSKPQGDLQQRRPDCGRLPLL